MNAIKMGMTIEEAAETSGIGRNTMRKLVDWGKLPVLKVGRKTIIRRDTALTINATYWTDLEIDYSEIETIEYRKNLDVGVRTSGFGSPKLSMGIFQNDEFGSYTLYSYTGAKEHIILTSGEKTLVIGMSDPKETQAIYDAMLEKVDK